jgi:hypothetical protein
MDPVFWDILFTGFLKRIITNEYKNIINFELYYLVLDIDTYLQESKMIT